MRILVNEGDIESARTLRIARDKIYMNIFEENTSDERWIGELGEQCFDYLIRDNKIQAKWLNMKEAADKPDFVLEHRSWSVDVKTVKRKVPLKENYTAQITARHAQKPVDLYFFCSYEFQKQIMWMIGIISKDRFLSGARYHGPGDSVHSNYRIRPGHEIYNLPVTEIVPTTDFIRWMLDHSG